MTPFGRLRRLTDGTTGKIVELLRRGPLTIEDLAAALGLTRTAVRSQVSSLLGLGAIEQCGERRGPSKPSRLFCITAHAEQQLSRAYIPALTHLLRVLSRRLPQVEFDELLREVGRSLATGGPAAMGTPRERVMKANELLRDLGGTTEVSEEAGSFVILGHGCPLAAATAEFPNACSVVESLLTEIIGQPVTSCCERYGRTRCCFEVSAGAA